MMLGCNFHLNDFFQNFRFAILTDEDRNYESTDFFESFVLNDGNGSQSEESENDEESEESYIENSSDDEDDEERTDEELNEDFNDRPVFPGANITMTQSLLMILTLVRHRISVSMTAL